MPLLALITLMPPFLFVALMTLFSLAMPLFAFMPDDFRLYLRPPDFAIFFD